MIVCRNNDGAEAVALLDAVSRGGKIFLGAQRMDLEASIRCLTEPVCGQYPRPWTISECIKHPEKARVFIVGYNQATPLLVEQVNKLVEGHNGYMDALFNRSGNSILGLIKRIKEINRNKRAGVAGKNIEALRQHLSKIGIDDVIQTNVICFGSPMAKDLAQCKPGMERGRKIFRIITEIIRPKVLIVHGVGTAKELRRAIPEITESASQKDDGVLGKHVKLQSMGEPYEPMLIFIPSLAPPECNRWKSWDTRVERICSMAQKFINEYQ